MHAYKLFKLRRNGTIGPLFINKKQVVPIGQWLEAEDHKTKGYAHRVGWHACQLPVAPHLKMKGRVWCLVDIEDFVELKRPAAQGTKWYIAQVLKVLSLMNIVHQNRFDNPTGNICVRAHIYTTN